MKILVSPKVLLNKECKGNNGIKILPPVVYN
jgi:hypothetical protein